MSTESICPYNVDAIDPSIFGKESSSSPSPSGGYNSDSLVAPGYDALLRVLDYSTKINDICDKSYEQKKARMKEIQAEEEKKLKAMQEIQNQENQALDKRKQGMAAAYTQVSNYFNQLNSRNDIQGIIGLINGVEDGLVTIGDNIINLKQYDSLNSYKAYFQRMDFATLLFEKALLPYTGQPISVAPPAAAQASPSAPSSSAPPAAAQPSPSAPPAAPQPLQNTEEALPIINHLLSDYTQIYKKLRNEGKDTQEAQITALHEWLPKWFMKVMGPLMQASPEDSTKKSNNQQNEDNTTEE